MTRARHLAGGSLVAVAVALGTALLSASPAIRLLPDGMAVVKLSVSHAGARTCRDRTDAEMARLPANMRRREICERRRLPVLIEMDIDGRPVVAELVAPGGIAGDAAAQIWRRFTVAAGTHDIALRMRDSDRTEGFDYVARRSVDLAPAQSLAIDFHAETGGFRLR